MIKPHFTDEQQDYLASIIDHWYLHWKRCIVVTGEGSDGQHRLGFAKEQLKSLVYWPENTREYIQACMRQSMIKEALELIKRYPELGEEPLEPDAA